MTVPGFERILGKRALLSALGPLAGTRATGDVTATASGANTVLPAYTYGVPVIGGKAITARMVKTLADVTVTSGGTAVAVRSVCGGPSGNLPAGTPILWQPCPSGIVARGSVAAPGITGGVASTGPGSCARVVAYDNLGATDARSIWEAQGEGFPAIIVMRTGSRPEGLATVRASRREHTFSIAVVSAHYAGNDERGEEGEILLDRIEQTLEGLEDVEGEVFSGPGVELGNEQRSLWKPNAHIWLFDCTIHYALPAIDARLSDGVSWQPWETTRIEVAEPAAGDQAARDIVDVSVDHT
jgi:hypothetical protein